MIHRLTAQILSLLVCFLGPFGTLPIAAASIQEAHPTDPASFKIDPGFDIRLYAREPDVVDPVALCFDEAGRMYVVEMRDYPSGAGPERRPGGTVRLVEDLDGDGKIDRVTLFADNLRFPTSVVPWKGGVFVSAPPEIIYLKDTNGDGKADLREVYYEGFVVGVTDSNVNGLQWGLDNRIHGANGGNGGEISRRGGITPPISIRNLDFSFDPATRDFQPTTQTSSGFQFVFDDWGHSFTTYNINHIQQRIVPLRYLQRVPGLPPVETTVDISDHDPMSRIYPISVPETRVNHPEQSGHFSSAGGMGYISTYPGNFTNSALVCDVVGNLVHRDMIVEDGPVFKAIRAPGEERQEFLAGRDLAFRPVGLTQGPDGALYLLDMQRDVIEHPDYIPEKVKAKLNLRAGEDRGRIYRITPKSGIPFVKVDLGNLASRELIPRLGHTNRWVRLTAQRLLVERQDGSIPAELRSTFRSSRDALLRLHVLWTLQGLRSLSEDLVEEALRDPALSENALILSENFKSQRLLKIAAELANDPRPRVRFQALLTGGLLKNEALTKSLPVILGRDHTNRWLRLACLTALPNSPDWSSLLLPSETSAKSVFKDWARELADTAGASASNSRSWTSLLAASTSDRELLVATLRGLASGLSRNPNSQAKTLNPELEKVFQAIAQSRQDHILDVLWALEDSLGAPPSAERTAFIEEYSMAVTNVTTPARLSKIALLKYGVFGTVKTALLALLASTEPAEIQSAALVSLKAFKEPSLAEGIVERWTQLAPSSKRVALNLLLERSHFHNALLTALENQRILPGELNLDLEQRRTLLRESTPEIHARAAKIFGDEEYANRKEVVSLWLEKLPKDGNAGNGRAVFEKNCAQCHAAGKLGHHVGPDLTDLGHRSLEDLLSNILDPNMAINPAFATYNVDLTTDETQSGILKSETQDSIELLQASDLKVVIPRQKIRRMRSSGASLMPEGFETVLTMQQMRDLLAFLMEPR